MAALPPAVLAYDHPRSLAAVLGGALPSSPLRDERGRGLPLVFEADLDLNAVFDDLAVADFGG
jgi:hypothetical protein